MPRSSLQHPSPESIIYEDSWLYVCLARCAITTGHAIVAWKKRVPDLHDLSEPEYDYLMEIVDIARDALLRAYTIKKVYLIYMDEIEHVHWHLVPRYNEKGMNVFLHKPKTINDFSRVLTLQKLFLEGLQRKVVRLPNTKRTRT